MLPVSQLSSHLRYEKNMDFRSYDKISDIVERGKRRAEMILDTISVFKSFSKDLLKMSKEQKRRFDLMQYMVDGDKLNHNQMRVNSALIAKKQLCRDQLHRVGEALIQGLNDTWGRRCHLGIRQIGEIDKTVFLKVCKLKLPAEEARLKALELHSFWQDKLTDPKWYPFHVVEVSEVNYQEVVNEKDQLLSDLKNECGEEIYNAVMTAFKELKEFNPQCNPGRRYTVSELWNFRDNRKASPDEVISFVFKQMNSLKRKNAPTELLNKTKKAKTKKASTGIEVNVVRESSNDEALERSESEEKPTESEQESGEDRGKKEETSSETKGKSAAKSKAKEVKISKKASLSPGKSLTNSPKSQLGKNDDLNAIKSPGKKKGESVKKSIPKESVQKESTGKNVLKVNEERNLIPTDEELRNAVSEFLKEVDFCTTTFYEILELLVKRFDTDLTPRKEFINNMIRYELTKIADALEDYSEEEEED